MKLLLTGVSHRTAPVEVRERLAFAGAALESSLRKLLDRDGIAEAVILSTCNRVEVAVSASDEIDAESVVDEFLFDSQGVAAATLGPSVYRHTGRDAIHHLFRVAASLDSMMIGEPQILGQLKAAHFAAKNANCLGGVLEGVLASSFRVAKRVRTETGIGQMAVSVGYAAVELARKIFGSLKGRRVMIVGGGKMSELATRHLRRSGASHIYVTNRTHSRAAELAAQFQGTPIEYDRFAGTLPEVDIVITSSGAPHYILDREMMQRAIAQRRNKPMFLIDIAVPRNIEPAVNEIDNVFLYDIDDLQEVVNSNLRERLKEAERAEDIVGQEVERMAARLMIQEVAPTILSLQGQLERIRNLELEKARRKLGPLTPEQEQALEALTRGIVNKIAHGPISELRLQAGRPEGVHIIDAIRKVFHLTD